MMNIELFGRTYFMESTKGLFSPEHADRGTLAMLSRADFAPGKKILDLGCGWGLVGVCAAGICGAENVWLADIDPRAIETARVNALRNGAEGAHLCLSDGLSGVDEAGFDMILANPPYQSDFSVAKRFIEKGFNRLKTGGQMMIVVKREKWYANKMRAVFGGVKAENIDGYWVLSAQRRKAERG